MASAPIGCNGTGIERMLTTKSTAILVPFCTQELFMPAPSIYYGLNALSNNMIMADRKRLRTPNGVILGTPGSGKSFSAKREILSCFLVTKDDIIICDPEGEYFALVGALHGQVVKLATDSKDYLNPMDIQLSHKGDKEALKLKSDFLITLCDLIAGGRKDWRMTKRESLIPVSSIFTTGTLKIPHRKICQSLRICIMRC